ncbi:hypothetical protein [Streptomyces xanthochromogenes]|uniref:hypothetical protein n=1 Tax=Streptomyces xanthochromogenes TaxID=67384 RepID=UPI002F41A2B0
MKRDPLLWAALGAVLVVLASAEYDLARACGFGLYVAAGVPGALDIYAVRALRAGRDVAAVVVTLILVNAASHLVTAGLLPVSVPLVVAVSAIAPLVLWRVHRLRLDEPVSEPADTPGYTPGYVSVAPLPAPSTRDVDPFQKAPKSSGVFTEVEPPRIRPELEGHGGRGGDGYTSGTPPKPVSEPDASDAPTEPGDPEDELTGRARKEFAGLLDEGRTPSIRQLRDTYSIGQVRAQLIQQQFGVRATR